MTKQLNLILNGKGGVGKSFFAVNSVQALKDQRRSFRAADTDDENSTLLRFHADAEFVNIQKPRETDRLFALLESTNLLIVDCRAASTDLFLDYFGEINLREVLGTLDARLTLVTPVNHEADSVEQLRLLSARLNDDCRYVVVKNQAHSEHFRIYEDSKTRARIVGELQGREITMSRLHDWLVTALNENNVTAGAALTHPAFSLIDRQRLKHWQRLFHEQLALADDLLLPQRTEDNDMNGDEALEQAVVSWRTKHQIREDDPMLAALDLVRVYLAHAPLPFARRCRSSAHLCGISRDGGTAGSARRRLRQTIARSHH